MIPAVTSYQDDKHECHFILSRVPKNGSAAFDFIKTKGLSNDYLRHLSASWLMRRTYLSVCAQSNCFQGFKEINVCR